MSEIKAGVTLISTFETSGTYSNYVDYMKRAEATTYENYTNYMANEEKSDGLFTETKNEPSEEEIKELKKQYRLGAKNGSVLEKIVISFDMEFLKEYNMIKDNQINSNGLKDYTRLAMKELIKKEGNMNNFIWSGAIHYNTDNIHIHISMVEPYPSWTVGQGRCVFKNGKPIQRGVIKLGSLNKAKSVVVNNIIGSAEKNKTINEIMFDSIINEYKANTEVKNIKRYKILMDNLIASLPKNMSLWKYNMNALDNVRYMIDEITDFMLEENFKEEYEDFLLNIETLDKEYVKAYGEGNIKGSFALKKEEELYARFGNAILKEAVKINKEKLKEKKKEKLSNEYKVSGRRLGIFQSTVYSYRRLKKYLKEDFTSMKNQARYDYLQEQEEYNKERE